MLKIAWVDGITVTGNSIESPSPLPLTTLGYILNLHEASNVTLIDNAYRHPGPSVTEAVHIGPGVQGITGNDNSGLALIPD